ncbi:uncharacterized protein BDR25DRAFT_347335 [Lindgomyces ingoldianus]|uniref:Uncharacterized protein n=1 Tax=Lindgomyces ingoldianus TaxID=673940 RepID=A0ACB6Q8I0_9PLEO|nr:uncharacterized protein BDR25DRAFT_347335 [Lindgomyces ingoldianus]KAF2463273.1 hypothetical protein BDR25DRAFT_347335 [Lindgomyces ingoldianus]
MCSRRDGNNSFLRPSGSFCSGDSSPPTPSSLLLQLPAEIRVMIWKYVIGGFHVRVITKNGRFVCRLCNPITWHGKPSTIGAQDDKKHAQDHIFRARSEYSTPYTRWGPLNLILVCRQICLESIDIFFTTNTFIFTNFYDFIHQRFYLYLLHSQSMRFVWITPNPSEGWGHHYNRSNHWVTVLSTLSTFQNLRVLQIFLPETSHFAREEVYSALSAFQFRRVRLNIHIPSVGPIIRCQWDRYCPTWLSVTPDLEGMARLEAELKKRGMGNNITVSTGGLIKTSEELYPLQLALTGADQSFVPYSNAGSSTYRSPPSLPSTSVRSYPLAKRRKIEGNRHVSQLPTAFTRTLNIAKPGFQEKSRPPPGVTSAPHFCWATDSWKFEDRGARFNDCRSFPSQ